MKKKVSLNEMKARVREFKKIIYSLRKANIRIYYNPEVINNVIFIERKKFESLLKNLELFEMTLIKDKRLEKFQHSLWRIDIDNNKLIIIAQNREIKQEVSLKINLITNTNLIITKKIL